MSQNFLFTTVCNATKYTGIGQQIIFLFADSPDVITGHQASTGNLVVLSSAQNTERVGQHNPLALTDSLCVFL